MHKIPKILREACIETFSQAKIAYENGADRLEVCANLKEGGTTPSYGFITFLQRSFPIPLSVMIRPRGGNFCYSKEEVEIMKEDIKICKSLGVFGVVFGLLTPESILDINALKELIKLVAPMKVTFHLAFDEIEKKMEAVDELCKLGVSRILTKGGKANALEGKAMIKALVEFAKDKIIIMPGGGVTKENYMELVEFTNAREVHGTKIA